MTCFEFPSLSLHRTLSLKGPLSIPAQVFQALERYWPSTSSTRSTRAYGPSVTLEMISCCTFQSLPLPTHTHIVCRLPCHQTRVMSLFLTEVSSSRGNHSLFILSPVNWGEHELQLLKFEWGSGSPGLLSSPFVEANITFLLLISGINRRSSGAL